MTQMRQIFTDFISSFDKSDPSGAPLNTAQNHGPKVGIDIGCVIMPGLKTEDAGLFEFTSPGNRLHTLGMGDPEQGLAAEGPYIGHLVGLINHTPGFKPLGNRMAGVGDLNMEFLIMVIFETAVLYADQL